MKIRILALGLLFLLLTACGGEGSATVSAPPDYVPTDTVAKVVADYLGWTDLSPLEQEDRDFYLSGLYGLEEGSWTEAAVYAAQGTDARELAIIRLSGEEQAEAVVAALEAYKESRAGDFFGYFPAQAALVEGGVATGTEGYVALLICDDPAGAVTALTAALNGEEPITVTPTATPAPEPAPTPEPEPTPTTTPTPASTPEPPPTVTPTATPEPDPEPTRTPRPLPDELDVVHFDPPNEYDMTLYDTSAILAAYASGEESGLSEKDAAILRVAARAIEDNITEDMTDFEKELALRNWMLRRGSYDDTVYTGSRKGRADNTNPYGYLVHGYGICLGYATTFQLLMDMAGVECVTVVGAAYHSTADHAWNMVKLEDEWYCVDTTWDPSGGYKYFNVTSDYMRETDHQWDYGNTPKATATRFYWDGEGDKPE